VSLTSYESRTGAGLENLESLKISSVGMITAVGSDVEMTAASVKCGTSASRDVAILNKKISPMKMALIPQDALPALNEELTYAPGLCFRQRRMLRLAEPALKEALIGRDIDEPIPLFLAVPEKLYRSEIAVQFAFINHLKTQTGINIDTENSCIFACGRAGGVLAIDAAFTFIQESGRDSVLVGGIDSYLDTGLLAHLDQQNRILALNISDGFIPGEGAAFVLLSSESISASTGDTVVYSPGLAEEAGHRYSDEPYRGEGLSAAISRAISNSSVGKPVEIVYSSLNGENFGAKEYGVAIVRNAPKFKDQYEVIHPADCYGDIGAASAVAMLCLAKNAKDKGDSRYKLIYCSSDMSARGAVCVA